MGGQRIFVTGNLSQGEGLLPENVGSRFPSLRHFGYDPFLGQWHDAYCGGDLWTNLPISGVRLPLCQRRRAALAGVHGQRRDTEGGGPEIR